MTVPLKFNEEYINVWDSCGIYGYVIPWAAWKAVGLYPTGSHRKAVDKKFVSLTERKSVSTRTFGGKPFPTILINDFEDGSGINWDKVRDSIIEVARASGCVLPVDLPKSINPVLDEYVTQVTAHIDGLIERIQSAQQPARRSKASKKRGAK